MKLLESLNELANELSTADQLCLPSSNKSHALSSILKSLYDTSVDSFSTKVGPFEELIVKDLDLESIWEELNSRNKPLTRLIDTKISKMKSKKAEEITAEIASDEDESEEELSEQFSEHSGSEADGIDDEEDDDNNDIDSDDESERSDTDIKITEAYVEDEDMDAWLDKTERQEEQHYLKLQRQQKRSAHKGVAEVRQYHLCVYFLLTGLSATGR